MITQKLQNQCNDKNLDVSESHNQESESNDPNNINKSQQTDQNTQNKECIASDPYENPNPSLQEEKTDYIKYTVKPDDSLIGISLKLNISQNSIKSINQFSGDTIFPGMVINLPNNCDAPALQAQQVKMPAIRPKISQLFNFSEDKKNTFKYEVIYLSSSYNIHGSLTICPNYIMFNPSLQNQENRKLLTTDKLLKYNVIIEIQDLKEVSTGQLLEPSGEDQQPKSEYTIKLLLFRVGNKKLEEKYRQRLQQLKLEKKAIASISFKAISQNQKEVYLISKQIESKISDLITKQHNTSEEEKNKQKGLTNIHYFDIMYANIIMKKDSLKLKEDELKQKIDEVSIKMIGQSIVPHDVFVQIAVHFPLMYQLHNWVLIYNCLKNGTSFNTMIRHCMHQDPLFLVIKQYKGNLFGAFLIDGLEFGRSGKGQMFIWKYDEYTKKVSVYKWTNKNQFFVFVDSDGIGIGMGEKYGIFINSILEKGFSSPTQTFGNKEHLSVNQDFMIDDIEIWGLQSTQ